jgi:hypothetical protein
MAEHVESISHCTGIIQNRKVMDWDTPHVPFTNANDDLYFPKSSPLGFYPTMSLVVIHMKWDFLDKL